MQQPRVSIIGGGAAGLSAAIAAARLGVDVTVLEAGDRVGRKILASGNGRCNLTNLSVMPSAFNHPDFVDPILREYPSGRICSFFGDMGLLTSADEEGRVYPRTNSAASVLDVLRLECAHLGVEVRCGFEVASVVRPAGSPGFEVASNGNEAVRADAVVVATGGGSRILADLGHDLLPGTPVLGPIRTDTAPIRGLSGVRVKCAATLLSDAADGADVLATERGELLFRDYGVSGIMVFDLSRHLAPGSVISIDFFPDVAVPELATMIAQRCELLAWRSAETFFAGMLHDRVARAVLRAAAIDPGTPVGQLPQDRLTAFLKDFRLDITGIGDAAQAQVTRGGASVEAFDPETLESQVVPGVFVAGEVLDVDGRSGGFNLHWAWASGIVAGEGGARVATAASSLRDVVPGGPE